MCHIDTEGPLPVHYCDSKLKQLISSSEMAGQGVTVLGCLFYSTMLFPLQINSLFLCSYQTDWSL